MKREDLPFLVDLKGRVIVVTGAGGVICSELAKALGACGAKVAYVDWNLEAAQAKVAEANKEGYFAEVFKCNVLSKEDLAECHRQINDGS